MKPVYRYTFYKTKYGGELLIDIVSLESIGKYIRLHPVHTLSYFDITFITGGSGRFRIDDMQYDLYPGDIIFSKPGQVRAWDPGNLPQGYALIFEEEFLLSFFNDRAFIQNLSYFHRNRSLAKINGKHIYPEIKNLIRHILAEINNEQSKDKHILRALLYQMLALLNREYVKITGATERNPRNAHIENFIKRVDEEFATHHNTGYYAGRLCITPNYLNEIVRNHLGTSPKRYIQERIIGEAKKMLAYTDFSVSEIAARLHFESSSYFIRVFRKYARQTPLQYRQNRHR